MIQVDLRRFEQNDFTRLIGWIKTPESLLQWAGPLFHYPLDTFQLEIYIQGTEAVAFTD